jgi:hypothetical protein
MARVRSHERSRKVLEQSTRQNATPNTTRPGPAPRRGDCAPCRVTRFGFRVRAVPAIGRETRKVPCYAAPTTPTHLMRVNGDVLISSHASHRQGNKEGAMPAIKGEDEPFLHATQRNPGHQAFRAAEPVFDSAFFQL